MENLSYNLITPSIYIHIFACTLWELPGIQKIKMDICLE